MKKANVLASMAAIAMSVVLAGSQAVQAQEPLQVTMDANNIWICEGRSSILQYCYKGVPFKPYVKELYSPGGVNVLLDAPADHLHHHGLMFAVSADGTNFWEETSTAGRQTQIGSTDVQILDLFGDPYAWSARRVRFAADVYWCPPEGRRPLVERRTIEVCRKNTPGTSALATALAWQSELTTRRSRVQPVTLTGSHYFGLGLRFPRSMDASGEFINADAREGTVFRGEERLVRSNWCAYRATSDGKPVTVAMFGHPDNPREPVTWFTMAKPFAYMSATLGLHEQALEVSPRQPLTLRYGVAIWDRHIPPVQIDAFYREWAVSRKWKLNEPSSPDANQTSKPR